MFEGVRWDDRVKFVRRQGNTSKEEELPLEVFHNRLLSHPYAMRQHSFYGYVLLAGLAAKFKPLITIPAGSIIKYIGLKVKELVVAGGTSVKLALGPNAGDVDLYGITTNLTVDQIINTLVEEAIITTETTIDLNAVVTDGSALGDTNISAGKVFFSITLLILPDLSNV